MARPRKGFDLEVIEKLAVIHCSNTEIAAIIGCDVSLLSKPRYSQCIAKGKERGKMSLRRKMFDTAMGGNVTMQIWLSKQYLGFADKVESKLGAGDPGFKIVVEDYANKKAKEDDKI